VSQRSHLRNSTRPRWAGRLSSLIGIKHRYCDVIKALAHIALENKNDAEPVDAPGADPEGVARRGEWRRQGPRRRRH